MSTKPLKGRYDDIPVRYVLIGGLFVAAVLMWEVFLQIAFPHLQRIFPSTVEILSSTYWLFDSGELYPHLKATGAAVLVAAVLAIVVGILFGTLLGISEYVAESIEPLLYYFSSVPKIILYPLILVAVGSSIESRIVMGFLSAMFPITVNAIVGTVNVNENFSQVARSFGGSRFQLFTKVYLPSTIPYHLNGIRLGMGVSIISVVLAEIFVSQRGMGNQISFYYNNLQMSRMYAMLLILFAFALLLNLVLIKFQAHLASKGYIREEEADETGF